MDKLNYRETDHRNLNLNKLNLDVCFGRSHNMIIWQPRILAWFSDKYFLKQRFPLPYDGMNEQEVYQSLGCSNRLYNYTGCFRVKDPPGVIRNTEKIDDLTIKYTVKTPVGSVYSVYHGSLNNWWHTEEKWWIETPEDMKVFMWLLERQEWEWRQEHYEKVYSEWDDIGAPAMWIPRVNVQNLYIDTMGVEKGIYAIYEWGEIINDYFKILHENHLKLIEIVNKSPVMLVNFGDNVHCSTLSPSLYEKYVLPAYIDRCEKLHKANKFAYPHWDGNTKSLLKYAQISGFDGIEAITPKPQGDVTLEEIKEALGDKIFYLDGIPAILFEKTFSEEELIAATEKVIKYFAPKLVLGISDEISSHGDIDRIKIVTKIVDDYNANICKNNEAKGDYYHKTLIKNK
jgi:hypothetical protein